MIYIFINHIFTSLMRTYISALFIDSSSFLVLYN